MEARLNFFFFLRNADALQNKLSTSGVSTIRVVNTHLSGCVKDKVEESVRVINLADEQQQQQPTFGDTLSGPRVIHVYARVRELE